MSDNNGHKEQRIGLWIAGSAAALSVLSVLFYAVWGWENGRIEGSPGYGQEASAVVVEETVAAASAPEMQDFETSEVLAAEPAGEAESGAAASGTAAEQILADTQTAAAGEGAQAVVENGVVKFYFATGKADLAANAEEALKDVLDGAKEGKKAVISGFHDATGNRAKNEELSKKRAFAVRDALLGLGVPESQIEMRKPENATGSGNNAEARRVEVVLE
ncbi:MULTISPECIES: OmpA family protein [unclassified Neisseria]|uniref:OmpA family protein n=1 Tax=unclassified Neisseria TaxID=2623750 RepID=UPI0010724B73|nr:MULTISPECIES: OmpA family protein [unclassified Neisseria]MBF0803246.1 OmpA family protein [Neisseria sp. 19428wB4_WF04]TFU44085.1 OmpA family protein [Neisseria sp. WF04]